MYCGPHPPRSRTNSNVSAFSQKDQAFGPGNAAPDRLPHSLPKHCPKLPMIAPHESLFLHDAPHKDLQMLVESASADLCARHRWGRAMGTLAGSTALKTASKRNWGGQRITLVPEQKSVRILSESVPPHWLGLLTTVLLVICILIFNKETLVPILVGSLLGFLVTPRVRAYLFKGESIHLENVNRARVALSRALTDPIPVSELADGVRA
jgi:hypothetical protein